MRVEERVGGLVLSVPRQAALPQQRHHLIVNQPDRLAKERVVPLAVRVQPEHQPLPGDAHQVARQRQVPARHEGMCVGQAGAERRQVGEEAPAKRAPPGAVLALP